MKVASNLIIGHILLSAINNGCKSIDIEQFDKFSSELNKQFKTGDYSEKYANISNSDVYNELHILSHYLDLEPNTSADDTPLNIKIKDNNKNDLKRKLNIYYESVTPDWLLKEMKKIKEPC